MALEQLSAQEHRAFMEQAIRLARRCVNKRGAQAPKVGALIVRDRSVLAKAHRGERYHNVHAELMLLDHVLKGIDLSGLTLYTTLEPSVYSTQLKVSCVEAIIERGLGRVVVGTLNPNRTHRGLGLLQLQEAGVQVMLFNPFLAREARDLNDDLFKLYPLLGYQAGPTGTLARPGDQDPHVGYNDAGDKVEWVEGIKGHLWQILLRNRPAIQREYEDLKEQLFWRHHQLLLDGLYSGARKARPSDGLDLAYADAEAQRIESKFGKYHLSHDEIVWDYLSGRVSALAWVLGYEWEPSFTNPSWLAGD